MTSKPDPLAELLARARQAGPSSEGDAPPDELTYGLSTRIAAAWAAEKRHLSQIKLWERFSYIGLFIAIALTTWTVKVFSHQSRERDIAFSLSDLMEANLNADLE